LPEEFEFILISPTTKMPPPHDHGEGLESLRGWPPLRKMDESLKAKVEILFGRIA